MNSFTDAKQFIEWVESQKRFSPKISLDKMEFYCSLFHHPEQKFKSIHVTGTNGKGSTVAYLTSIFKMAGLHVATFTSPYITIFNERIQYDQTFISDETLLQYGNLILSKYDEIRNHNYDLPSFFEFITLIAFLYFANLPDLDIAIIEVGMGGRLDATNVIRSELAIITNVAYDHMHILGDTLEKIAFEKMGIVKNKVPLICGVKEKNLQTYILSLCEERGSFVDFTFPTAFEIQKMDIYGSQIRLDNDFKELEIGLAGEHQIENALVALHSIQILNKKLKGQIRNFPISNVILKEGLKNVSWPGRLEILNQNPLIVTDGAHNIDGMSRICNFIQKLPYPYKRAVVSISKDKEKEKMIQYLDQTFDEIIFTKYSYARSATAEELYHLSVANKKICVETIDDACQYTLSHPCAFTIFIGSLYLVSDIKKKIEKRGLTIKS